MELIHRAPRPPIPTFKRLDDIVTILGGTKMAFYPFLTGLGADVRPYGAGNGGIEGDVSDDAGRITLQGEWDPFQLNGVYAYYFDRIVNNHLSFDDDGVYSHGDGSVDTAVSWGAWIYPMEALGGVRSIMGKHEALKEEYDFRFDASGNLVLELHDASASATEIGTGASDVLVPWVWNFVVATYDGAQAAPDVHLYRNASDTLVAGTTVESGAYVAMEDSTARFLIGARNTTGAPAQEFGGYMWGPFIVGKELTQAHVSELYGIGQELIGLI